MSDATGDELSRARDRRDRLRARMAFWEHWKGVLLVPLMVGSIGSGWAIGWFARAAFHLPAQTEFYTAVVALVIAGRVVSSYFDARKLEAARRRADALERRRPPVDEK